MKSNQLRLQLTVFVLLSLLGIIDFYYSSNGLKSALTKQLYRSQGVPSVSIHHQFEQLPNQSAPLTGSFAICEPRILPRTTPHLVVLENYIRGTVEVSCQGLYYQTPNINYLTHAGEVTEKVERKEGTYRIIIGILSSAESPQKMSRIWQNWSQNQSDV